jgi:hypothetical protein
MIALLHRLDADPWIDGFYAVPERKIFVLQRLEIPTTIAVHTRADVLRRGSTSRSS